MIPGKKLTHILQTGSLTWLKNMALGAKLSEYHTGLREFALKVPQTLLFEENSDDFVFDCGMLIRVVYAVRTGRTELSHEIL